MSRRILSFILAFCILLTTFTISFSSPESSLDSNAAGVNYTVFQQGDLTWGSYNTYSSGATIAKNGCGLMSIVNAVYYLNGNIIDIKALADWAYSNGYYGTSGTYKWALYPNLAAKFGAKYGFTTPVTWQNGYITDSTLINHLKNGGTAVGHVKNHFICIADYDTTTGRFLILDSSANYEQRFTSEGGSWLSVSELSTDSSYMIVDGYCLISNSSSSVSNYNATASVSGLGSVFFGNDSTSGRFGAGDTVFFRAIPASGYKVSSISVNGTSITVQSGGIPCNYSFTMPYANATVSVTFSTGGASYGNTAIAAASSFSLNSPIVVRADGAKPNSYIGLFTSGTTSYSKNTAVLYYSVPEYWYSNGALGTTRHLQSGFRGGNIGAYAAGTFKLLMFDSAGTALTAATTITLSGTSSHSTAVTYTPAGSTGNSSSSSAATYTVTAKVASGSGTVHFGNGVTTATVTAGTVVNYQVTPADGYKVSKITIYGTSQTILNNGGEAVYQFTMEAANATVSVTFEATSVPTYNLTASVASGEGTVHFGNNITSTKVAAGTTVNYQVTPAAGYKVSKVLVYGTSQTILNNGEEAVYQFTMEAADATVSVTFEKVAVTTYTVTSVVAAGEGSVHFGDGVTSAQVAAGTTVNYQVTPADGYKVSKIVIYGTSQTIKNDGGEAVYQFPMEAADATVSVTFEEAEVPVYSLTATVASGQGSVHFGDDVTSTAVQEGTIINFRVTPASGYKASAILVNGTAQTITNDGENAVYQFTMGAADTVVSVSFVRTSYLAGVYEITYDSTLNVRSESNTNGDIIGYLSTGDRITAIEIVNTNWAKFIYQGQIGYVSVKEAYATLINENTIPESDIIFDRAEPVAWIQASGLADATADVKADPSGDICMAVTASASNDPQLNMDFTQLGTIDASVYKYMVITAKTTSSNVAAKMYLCPGSITAPTEDCTASWGWTNDGLWHDYVIDLSSLSTWSGALNNIRFDFFDGTTTDGSVLYLRSIKFYTSKPSTATVKTNKTSYSVGSNITLSYSGLDSYLGTLQNQVPFVAIYAEGTEPGDGKALLYTQLTATSGSVTFPTGATGGTALEQTLPAGNYTAWIAYDATGSADYMNLNNVHYLSSSASKSFTIVASGSSSCITEIENGNVIATQGYTVADAVSELTATFAASSVTITTNGATCLDTAKLATGMVITADSVTYTLVVTGDVDCDGSVTIADAATAMAALKGTKTLKSAQYEAAYAVSGNTTGKLNILDIMALLSNI